MFGVDTLKSYAEMTCDSLTPDFVSYISVRTYDFLVVTTSRKFKSSKRLRRGGAFVLSPCLAKSSRYPPQTWAIVLRPRQFRGDENIKQHAPRGLHQSHVLTSEYVPGHLHSQLLV